MEPCGPFSTQVEIGIILGITIGPNMGAGTGSNGASAVDNSWRRVILLLTYQIGCLLFYPCCTWKIEDLVGSWQFDTQERVFEKTEFGYANVIVARRKNSRLVF
jgi:hypothetical protein